MSLHIRDEQTCRMIRELASLTGKTLTEAVTVALREALDRERTKPKDGTAGETPGFPPV